MSKVKAATCSASTVKIGSFPVDATILSQGKASSTGIAIIDDDEVTYVASNATDIHDLIGTLTNLIQLVSDTFSAIGTGMTGPTTAPPGSLPTAITQLATMKSTLTTMKDNLK